MRYSKFILLTLALASGLPGATTIIRGPYLQSATPNSLVIRWRTDTTEASIIRFGLERNALTSSVKSDYVTTEHIVQLTKLTPGTRYYYSFGEPPKPPANGAKAPADAEDAPGRMPTYSFVTPPETGPAHPTRMWVLGDPGTKNDMARAVRDAYYKYNGNHATDIVLLLGDNAYPDGTDADYQKAIFEMYPEVLRSSTLWPALGNHDGKSANSITQSGVYYDIFTLPTRGQAGGVTSGTEAYYSFDYANIHMICLDSHDSDRSPESAMAQWLKADLAATTRDWIVAYFHHPTYTKGTHDSDKESDSGRRMIEMRANFLPILEAAGTDLILTGHSHVYERSSLLDGHYGPSSTFNPSLNVKQKGSGPGDVFRKPRTRVPHDGELSVVAGSAGHAGAKPPPFGHPVMVVSLNEPGSAIVDIDGLRLDLVFLNDKGEKRDSFSIVKE
jgi:hypothetical protein